MSARTTVAICGAALLVGGTMLLGEQPAVAPDAVAKSHARLSNACRSCHAPFRVATESCTTCHGQVNKMPLMWQESTLQMSWCLECHRHPERFVRPRSEVFSVAWVPPQNQLEMGRKLMKEYKIQSLTSCSTCHR